MKQVTVREAQATLPTLITSLRPGEEVLITQGEEPVARLIATAGRLRRPRLPGSAVGKLVILQEDNAHLEDFKEYMPGNEAGANTVKERSL